MQSGKRTNVAFPRLYFLPEITENGHVSVRPRFTPSASSPIEPLATFLDRLLRPLFHTFAQSVTLLNGCDFIQRLETFCCQIESFFRTTKFVTFEIHNLEKRASHWDILTAVNRFLNHQTVQGRQQRLTSDTIEQLVAIVLQNNVFTYQGSIYRHVRGSPLSLPFTRLLLNIYLHNWQLPLVRQMRLDDEFYGRYDAKIFTTWFGQRDKLAHYVNDLNRQCPDVQLTMSIDLKVNFLNAHIENRKGKLYTCVEHDPKQQAFVLPYAADHPRLAHRQWFRFALLRAGQYCTVWEDFNYERVNIELTFLANGYSLEYVDYHLQQFFNRFNPPERRMQLSRWTYSAFRKELFRYLNDRKRAREEQQQLVINHQLIHLYYFFDWGNRCEFNRQFHELWKNILEKDPVFQKYGLVVQLRSKHCYPSNSLFLQ